MAARKKTPKPAKRSRATPARGAHAAAEPSRRDRVLAAARTAFLTRGYAATHIVDIAKAAGFSKRTVYLDFPSKGALYATLFEEAIERLRAQLAAASDAERDVAAKIHAIAEAYLRFYREERGAYRLLFVWRGDILDDAPPAQQQRLKDLEAACVGVLADALTLARDKGFLREGLEPWPLAVTVWSAQNGALLVEEQGRLDVARVAVEELYWTSYGTLVRGALAMRG